MRFLNENLCYTRLDLRIAQPAILCRILDDQASPIVADIIEAIRENTSKGYYGISKSF